jgi:adenylate kinase
MALNLIMLGSPGAGKGTQAERFAREQRIPKISTGDILRRAVDNGTEMGKRVKAIMDRGDLVNDDVMTAIVRERLEQPDARDGFVLDGFPRTVAQAMALDTIVNGRGPLIVVHIVVPESELVRRLGTRLICADCGADAVGVTAGESAAPAVTGQADHGRCRRCGGALIQRADDREAVVLERLKVYHRDTEPLVEHYRRRPTFRAIDGAKTPEAVAAELAVAVDIARQSDPSSAGDGGSR